ncbi:MAG TPA: hypothetical protein VFE78_08140 [Gemmataceae bacterium]|nr:hypothetical protein [Gemmataceae bacterium]
MREAKWLACTDPRPMLAFLKGKASARKLRLFACACCRSLWPLHNDPRIKEAVQVAERWADGLATPEELEAHRAAARLALKEARLRALREADRGGLTWATLTFHLNHQAGALEAAASAAAPQPDGADGAEGHRFPERAAWGAMLSIVSAIDLTPHPQAHETGHGQSPLGVARGHQPALLRELFGNPFRPVPLNPAWLSWGGGPEGAEARLADTRYSSVRPESAARAEGLFLAESGTQGHPAQAGVGGRGRPHRIGALFRAWRPWGGGTVAELAQSIYEGRAFDLLPVLADALEGAGCTDADLLGHLCGPGPHARGCWALDLLLGKS